MGVPAHVFLLCHQQLDVGCLVFALLQRLEGFLLRLRHRTADAVTFAPKLAHVDTGARNLFHCLLSLMAETLWLTSYLIVSLNFVNHCGRMSLKRRSSLCSLRKLRNISPLSDFGDSHTESTVQ